MTKTGAYLVYIQNELVFSPLRVQGSGGARGEDLKWNQHARGHQGFALFPQLAPGLQMHRPRQGCTSLGSTETLLCSGSWSPDALIETLRPCRNQREGKGEQGRGCKHIWHLQKKQKTLHTTLITWEKCTGHIDEQALFFLRYHTCGGRYTHPRTYPIVCLLPLQSRKVIMRGTGQEGTTILQLVGHHQNTLRYCSIYKAHQTMLCWCLKKQISGAASKEEMV